MAIYLFILLICMSNFVAMKSEIAYEPFFDKALNHQRVCSQPKVIGPCKAGFPRFYYNTVSKSCDRFLYGGCLANDNNFEIVGECKRVCIDKQPCPIPSLIKPREGWRYDEGPDDKGCPKFLLVNDVKPGKCPATHPKARPSACTSECAFSDQDCPANEKCCKIGCNRLCVPPAS